jgi:hypothetical protein
VSLAPGSLALIPIEIGDWPLQKNSSWLLFAISRKTEFRPGPTISAAVAQASAGAGSAQLMPLKT